MAKHPVPKKKHSKTRSKTRYNTYKVAAQKRLTNAVQLVACSNCAQPRRVHHACAACGMYRGRQVLDMQKKMTKVTKIQA